jgi:hypothetical protein
VQNALQNRTYKRFFRLIFTKYVDEEHFGSLRCESEQEKEEYVRGGMTNKLDKRFLREFALKIEVCALDLLMF